MYDIAHMGNLKKWYQPTYLQNRNKTHRLKKQTCGYQGGKVRVRGKPGSSD